MTSNTAISPTGTLATVNVLGFDTLTLWVDYAKGDENNVAFTTYWLHAYGGDEFQEQNWSSTNGIRALQGGISYSMTTTGTAYISYDVTGIPFFVTKYQAGGSPSAPGVITVTYSATKE